MTPTTRADLHVHSTASQVSRLGVQRALGLPECATPPEEVYALAKRRGMDFVTITDHDTIAGALEIADRDDVFVSEELTAGFRGEAQLVHILCLGITPDDHDWLQAHAGDVEVVAAYLHEHDITCALAHPFYAVGAPLTPRHRRRLAQLFPIWEVRNGSRAPELNLPAAIYIDTHGGTGVGGTDDHAGVDIGRTWTEAPAAATPAEYLAHVRAGRVSARGDQGSAAKWAHSAMALAVRALGRGDGDGAPDPTAVIKMVERVMSEGDVREGAMGSDLGPDDARALLRAWLASIGLELDDAALLERMQSDGFSHGDLLRRARRCHERKLQAAVGRIVASAAGGESPDWGAALMELFEACIPAVPYAPAAAFLGREKHKLARARPRAGARRARRRRTRRDARRHPHARRDPRARRPGLRGRGDRHRRQRRPPPERRGRGRHPLLRRPEGRRAEPAGGRRGAGRGPLRPRAPVLAGPGRRGGGADRADHGAAASPAPTTPSWPPTRRLRTGDARLELGDAARARRVLRRLRRGALAVARRPTRGSWSWASRSERIGRWDRGVDIARFSPARREPGRFGGSASTCSTPAG